VPVMNPDGHERFGPNHRPNQRGPEQMGFRTNAARLNLNRDFVKADAPETQAVLRLIAASDPVLTLDLHTTDGAKFEHDISINAAPIAPRSDRLDEAGNELSAAVAKRLTELGHLPVEFYPAFRNDEDPASGFARTEAPPRFCQFYVAARSRLGILVETHSWRSYRERASSTYHTLQAVFELARHQARRWRSIELDATHADAKLAGTSVPMTWDAGPDSHPIAFRGYAYEKRVSELTGGTWLVYDETNPQVWTVPLFDQLVPAVTVRAPAAGYIVDGGYASAVAAVLDRHGLTWNRIRDGAKLDVETFRATSVTFQPPYEGRTRAQLEGAWAREPRTLDRGAIFVPIAQPGARLVLHLFEPTLPDSLAQWGLFNTVFERKEYMEPYVTEEAARAMIARDPSVRAAFDAAVAADPAMATSPTLKLEWFYRRHPAWDERLNLLPVYRASSEPALVH
ncbi:MAG: peptidase M14, partial [Kofleriaceae bacterium]